MRRPRENDPAGRVRELLLEAAERLFAEHGVAATSVRMITTAAAANVAAIHYYFGSQEGLLRELISRHQVPLNQQRLDQLAACQAASRPKPPPAEAVLTALVAPAIALAFTHPYFARLASRLRAELDTSLWQEYRANQAELTQRFQKAFQLALPQLPPEEVAVRCHYVLGGIQHLWAHCPLPAGESIDVVQRRFLAFYGAGLAAIRSPG